MILHVPSILPGAIFYQSSLEPYSDRRRKDSWMVSDPGHSDLPSVRPSPFDTISHQPELPGRSLTPALTVLSAHSTHWLMHVLPVGPSHHGDPPAGLQAEGQLDGVGHQGRPFAGQRHNMLPWTGVGACMAGH